MNSVSLQCNTSTRKVHTASLKQLQSFTSNYVLLGSQTLTFGEFPRSIILGLIIVRHEIVQFQHSSRIVLILSTYVRCFSGVIRC